MEARTQSRIKIAKVRPLTQPGRPYQETENVLLQFPVPTLPPPPPPPPRQHPAPLFLLGPPVEVCLALVSPLPGVGAQLKDPPLPTTVCRKLDLEKIVRLYQMWE